MWEEIKQAIVSIIKEQVTLVADENVLDYEKSLPDGYPAITVVPDGGDGEFLDTQRNQRNYTFKIRIFHERITDQREAERIVTAVLDQFIAVFDDPDQTTLDNTVIFNLPSEVSWGYITAPDIDVRIAEVKLTAVTVANA